MRIFSSVFLSLLLLAVSLSAQTVMPTPGGKPLTQAEYVQLLYTLERNPSKKDEVVETVRKRGIGFVLTDGLRSLTASKSKSDAELRRTLEEAARRKENPEAFQLPDEKESATVLIKARENSLAAVEEMPDFLVKQVILRSLSYAGTNKFTSTDRLVIAVGYRAGESEQYRLLSRNGIPEPDSKESRSYESVGGTTSAGEFVTILKTIFKSDSLTKFTPVDTDVLRGQRAIVFSYEITRDLAKQVIGYGGSFEQETISGMKGKIWINRDKARVLRVESQATEIPDSFPVRAASRVIDYEWITINNQKYLLPTLSEVRLTSRENRELLESRNEIRFRDYQKYDVDIKLLDDEDIIEEEEPKPAATPAPIKKP